ncbi:MAG: class II aldolase/adducin family protein [Candidatus Nitrotoga sp.]
MLSGEGGLRQQLLDVSQHLLEQGLNRGTSGNAAVRCGEDILITPSAMAVAKMLPADIVRMDLNGNVLCGGKPTSEWRFHRDILANRPDVSAVIHTHSAFATTLACLRKDIPALHYMIAAAGGNIIRCTPYALFGEQTLSDYALPALDGRKACLLANHGMIALGSDLADALTVAIEVEFLCELYWRALQAGEPHILTPRQIHDVQEKFVDYKKCT